MSWSVIVVGLASLFVTLTVHELGHLVAARLCGFRFGLLGVGPVCLMRSRGRVRVRWLPPTHWGPFAVAYPIDTKRLYVRAGWVIAGGPLASLAMAILAVVWLCVIPPDAAGRGVVLLLSLMSGLVFVATVQPFGTGSGVPSDGARLWDLVRQRASAHEAAALWALSGLTHAGVRPRDWDPALMALADKVAAPPAFVVYAGTEGLRWAIDHDDCYAAGKQVRRIRHAYVHAPRWLRAEAAAEVAFWLAYRCKDVAAAREYLPDARGPLVETHRRLRAEAVVLLESGDGEQARAVIEQAKVALTEGHGTASSLDRELLVSLERELDAKPGGTPAPA